MIEKQCLKSRDPRMIHERVTCAGLWHHQQVQDMHTHTHLVAGELLDPLCLGNPQVHDPNEQDEQSDSRGHALRSSKRHAVQAILC
jgi:hypothetical protein